MMSQQNGFFGYPDGGRNRPPRRETMRDREREEFWRNFRLGCLLGFLQSLLSGKKRTIETGVSAQSPRGLTALESQYRLLLKNDFCEIGGVKIQSFPKIEKRKRPLRALSLFSPRVDFGAQPL